MGLLQNTIYPYPCPCSGFMSMSVMFSLFGGLATKIKAAVEALSSCFKLISSDNNIKKLGQVCIISEVIG